MEKAFSEALNAKGFQLPNPMVGSVLVKDNIIIGKGYHEFFGKNHAEVNAIIDAENNGFNVEDSDIYVTLQPCSKQGKTPACSELIINKGIKKVFIGSKDRSDSESLKQFEKNNIDYEFIDSNETNELIKDFNWNNISNMPYVIGKLAINENGDYIANKKNNIWITGESTREIGRRLRYKTQSILVGENTINVDDPLLNTRMEGYSNPSIVVVSPKLNIDFNSNIFKSDVMKYIFTEKKELSNIKNVEFINIDFNENSTTKICKELFSRGIKSILIEGGKITLNKFIEENNINQLHVFYSGENKELDPIKLISEDVNYINKKKIETKEDSYYVYEIKE